MSENSPAWFEVVDHGTRVVYRLRPLERESFKSEWKHWIMPVLWFSSSVVLFLLFVPLAESTLGYWGWKILAIACFLIGLQRVVREAKRIWGHDELELTSRRIRISQCLGRLRLARSVSVCRVDQFTVVKQHGDKQFTVVEQNWNKPIYYSLYAEGTDGTSTPLVSSNSQSMLQDLAGSLSFRLKNGFVSVEDDFELQRSKLPVRFDSEIPTEIIERLEKPYDLGASIEHKGDSVILRLSMLTSSAKRSEKWTMNKIFGYLLSFLVVGVFVCGFGLFLFYLGGYGLMDAWKTLVRGEKMINGNPWVALVFGVVFIFLGCAFWLQILLHFLRRTCVIVTPAVLIVENRWLSKVKRKEWSGEHIKDIKVIVEDNRGKNSEGGPDFNYFIRLDPSVSALDGKSVTLDLGTRSKQELEWIASTCRGILGLPSQRSG